MGDCMRKKIIFITMFIVIIGIIILARNNRHHREEKLTLGTAIQVFDKRHREELEAPLRHSEADYMKATKRNGLTEDEIGLLLAEGETKEVTKQQAIEDAKMLFSILENAYAGYDFFGGEEVFSTAYKGVIEDIVSSGKEVIDAQTLGALFRRHLIFAEDSHLMIDHEHIPFLEKNCYYAVGYENIKKEESGRFYIEDQGKKWYMDQEVEKYIKYTILPNGQIGYALFNVCNVEEKKQLLEQVKVFHRSEKKVIPISWKLCDIGTPSGIKDKRSYVYEEREGIPIVAINEMTLDEMATRFINDGKKLRDKDVFILDLRHCCGGYLQDITLWLYNVTGALVGSKEEIQLKDSRLCERARQKALSQSGEKVDLFLRDNNETIRGVKSLIDSGEAAQLKWLEQDSQIFVLVDKVTSSSGEEMIRRMKTMSNVIVVGTNSNGCLLTGFSNASNKFYLPHSKLGIKVPDQLVQADDMMGYDARGTLPDIYIGNEDALDAVLACVNFDKNSR